jgi:hypothetical protein
MGRRVSMTNEEMKKISILDDVADGVYTDPNAYVDLDMLAVRKYMKENNIKRALTDEEIAKFKRS